MSMANPHDFRSVAWYAYELDLANNKVSISNHVITEQNKELEKQNKELDEKHKTIRGMKSNYNNQNKTLKQWQSGQIKYYPDATTTRKEETNWSQVAKYTREQLEGTIQELKDLRKKIDILQQCNYAFETMTSILSKMYDELQETKQKLIESRAAPFTIVPEEPTKEYVSQ